MGKRSFHDRFLKPFGSSDSGWGFDTMIQNIILPQIGLALEQKNNAMKGDHDVLETHEGRPRCFDTMIQNIILPQIGLVLEQKITP